MVGGAPVSGHVGDVSVSDIRAAIAAAGKAPQHAGGYHVYAIEVRSSTEIDLYCTPAADFQRFDVVRRYDGKWRYDSEGFAGTEYFPTTGH